MQIKEGRPIIEEVLNLCDLELVEDILKDFVVLNHLILVLGFKVHLVHGHNAGMGGVHQLALDRT